MTRTHSTGVLHQPHAVHLMAQMLEPKAGETIYDPTCWHRRHVDLVPGRGAAQRWRHPDHRSLRPKLINITAAIARMNLVRTAYPTWIVATRCTNHLIEGDRLKTFDVVLANPPYSIKWNREAWQSDQWGRNFLGTPPQGRADYAFFQHVLNSMDPKTGVCHPLSARGALPTGRKRDALKLIESDLVEAVVGLGKELFYNSPMEACVVICRSQKPEERKNKTLIHAVKEVPRSVRRLRSPNTNLAS